jgi:hypothetical protein
VGGRRKAKASRSTTECACALFERSDSPSAERPSADDPTTARSRWREARERGRVSGGGEPAAVARAARVARRGAQPARRLLKNPAASRAKKTRAWRDVADARLQTPATARRATASRR